MHSETTRKISSKDYFDSEAIAVGLRGKASKGAIVTVTAQAAKFVLQTGTTMVLARLLIPEDFGLVAMVLAVTGFVTIFTDFGFTMATIQRDTLTHEQVSSLFWINAMGGMAMMLVIAAMAPLVGLLYHRHELVLLTLAYAGVAPITSLAVQHTALLQRNMEFGSLAVRDLTALVIGGVAAILAAVMGAGYWSLIIKQAVYAIVSLIAVWMGCSWRPGRFRVTKDASPLILFGGRVAIADFLGYISNNLDSLVIGYFLGARSLGFYSRAQNLLMEPLRQVLSPILSVANPSLSRVANDPVRFRQAMCELIRKVTLIFAVLAAILIPMSDWVVRVLLGPGWSEAAGLFAVLGTFGFIEPCAFALSSCLLASGHPGVFAKWRVASVICLTAGIMAGLPWGMLGVAVAYAGTGIFLRTPLLMWWVGKNTPVSMSDILKSIIPFVTAGVLVCLLLLLLRQIVVFSSLFSGIAICGTSGMLLYLGLVACLPISRKTLFELGETAWTAFSGIIMFTRTRALSAIQFRGGNAE